MAEITLRGYLEEIDGRIKRNQLEEAVAHCRHILTYFPKNLEAMRLLGKAYLEQGRHGGAADIFQRVLSALPDDFVAHVGMGIIREDEGNLGAAIFHLERAFEVNPSNAPIQEELRRLTGRRDGLEPPRIFLTRGALARMYANGELYPQAVAELRAVLARSPDRVDLQALLAEAYWRNGQQLEAAETSVELLKRLPYCRKANQILAELWQDAGRPEEASTYRARLVALDPYEGHANGKPALEVAADTVRLQKLAYDPHAPSPGHAAFRPDRPASPGVSLPETAAVFPADESVPMWLPEVPPGDPSPGRGDRLPEPPLPDLERAPGLPPETSQPDWLTPVAEDPSPKGSAPPESLESEPVAAEPGTEPGATSGSRLPADPPASNEGDPSLKWLEELASQEPTDQLTRE